MYVENDTIKGVLNIFNHAAGAISEAAQVALGLAKQGYDKGLNGNIDLVRPAAGLSGNFVEDIAMSAGALVAAFTKSHTEQAPDIQPAAAYGDQIRDAGDRPYPVPKGAGLAP